MGLLPHSVGEIMVRNDPTASALFCSYYVIEITLLSAVGEIAARTFVR
jgi:hypothetical protein